MKPLKLTIAGLHSFREKQIIDFETLCEGGVFGIFGPTGSGKSSILDAMTLALYGKVERASNNTQGIMNHAEDVLEVSFLFELENGSDAKRYKVERTFKRTDELRVKSGISRLVEINGTEQVVLADKSSDVNQHILSILGLTIDDFTRAVVLPQGKFAEFLSLKGADRRQMLQRLFHLEKYGDELNRKIKDELQDKTIKLGEITAEQQGLGEASKEAVEEAEKAYKELAVTVEKTEKELTLLEKTFEEQKKKWEWQQEKERLTGRLEVLKEQEEEITLLQVNIIKADEAKYLQPLLEDLTQVKGNLQKWEELREEVKEQLHKVKIELEMSSKQYEKHREEKHVQQPRLLARKEQIIRANQLEGKVIELSRSISEITNVLEKKQLFLKNQEEEMVKLSDTYERAIAKQKQLKDEINQISIPMEQVELIENANQDKQVILQKEKAWREAQVEEQEVYKKIQSLQLQKKETSKLIEVLKEKLTRLFRKTEAHYHTSASISTTIDWIIAEVDRLLKVEKQKIDKANLKRIAHEISKELKAGEPCLVCGSTTHDGGIIHLEEVIENSMVANYESLFDVIQKEKQMNATVKVKYEQLAYELHQELKEVKVEPKIYAESEVTKIKDVQYDVLYQITDEQIVLQKGIRQDFIQLQQTKEEYVKEWRALASQQDKLTDAIRMYEQEWQKWSNRLQQLKEELDSLLTSWNGKYSTLHYDKIELLYQNVRNTQKQVEELNGRIEKSVDFIEQKEKELQQLKEARNQMDKEVLQYSSTKNEKEMQIKEVQKELKDIVGEDTPSTLLLQVEQALEQLTKKEEESYQQWQKAQSAFHDTDNKGKQADQMIAETTNRLLSLETKWNTQLEQSIFNEVKDVKEAIPYIVQSEMWKKKVDAYWDNRKVLEKQLDEIVSLIGESLLREEEWQQLQERLAQQKQAVREQLEAKSAAFHSLTSLKSRHERFAELEEKKLTLTNEKDKLQKLQSVFKGNSFVEYLAEEQLMQISVAASERLGALTHQRYALEIDSQGGFVIRDDANGGVRRPVSSLSGGETFLTSLALALSLSAQIQLRGEYPLQFFFLDEGFGTLDAELLDGVVTALEKLQSNHLAVGVISHVAELRARLPRRLVVSRAEPSGKGSTVQLETL